MLLIVGCHDITLYKREHLTLTNNYSQTYTHTHTQRGRESLLSCHNVPWRRHLIGPLPSLRPLTYTQGERKKEKIIG